MNPALENIRARRGRWKTATQMIAADPGAALAVMAGVIVTRCELLWDEPHVLDYVGLSPHFEELQPGEATPSYRCVIAMGLGEEGVPPSIDVRWEREP